MHNSFRGAAVFTAVTLFAASVSTLGGENAWGSMMDGSKIFIDFEDDAAGNPILAGQKIDSEFAEFAPTPIGGDGDGADVRLAADMPVAGVADDRRGMRIALATGDEAVEPVGCRTVAVAGRGQGDIFAGF